MQFLRLSDKLYKQNKFIIIILFVGAEQIDFHFDEVEDDATFMSPDYSGTMNTSV